MTELAQQNFQEEPQAQRLEIFQQLQQQNRELLQRLAEVEKGAQLYQLRAHLGRQALMSITALLATYE